MSLAVEVANYETKNALLPTIEVRIRSRVAESVRVYASSAICDVYFGHGADLQNSPFVASVPVIVNQWVEGNNWYDFRFDLTFSQEILYRIEKLMPVGQDANFTIQTRLQYFIQGQQVNSLGEPRHGLGDGWLNVKASDWARIAYHWGKDSMLMPIATKLHEKIKELVKARKYGDNTDEVIEEMYNRLVKQDLER